MELALDYDISFHVHVNFTLCQIQSMTKMNASKVARDLSFDRVENIVEEVENFVHSNSFRLVNPLIHIYFF